MSAVGFNFFVRLLPPLLHTGLTRRTNIAISLIYHEKGEGKAHTYANVWFRQLSTLAVLLALPICFGAEWHKLDGAWELEGDKRPRFKWPESLWWLVPVMLGAVFEVIFFVPFVTPETMNHHKEIFLLLIPFCVVAPVGGWWAIYQCIRREQHPVKYLAIVIFVPLGFIWYYFERYRLRIAQP